MTRMLRRAALASFASALLVAPVAADEHGAEQEAQHEAAPSDWDQEKVTALAKRLADAATKLQEEVARQRDQMQVGSGQAKAMLSLRDNLRTARNQSRSLAASLEKGEGRDATTPTYRRLMTLVRDARTTARRLFLQQPALDYADEANQALDGLAPYYPDVKPG